MPALTGVLGQPRVQERDGGRRGDAEAFRRALRQQQDGTADGAPPGDREAPVRPGLQPRRTNGRNQDGATAHHVDVVA
ncbi:MAG: hypothetical protein JNL08_06870 [Planctomycetes bacterium]|nr:hypothetical protein [Planctomycetota bacterium]